MYTCFLATALLADYVVQPWLLANPGILGPLHILIGSGPGAAFALLYMLGGLGMILVSVAGLCSRRLCDDERSEGTSMHLTAAVENETS